MNRPPPYFPQGQLLPPDPNRYKKFRRIMIFAGFFLLLILGGGAFAIYYLVAYLFR